MIHPILAVIAVGGLIYSLSPMCPPATRWPQRVCYGVMLLSGMVVSLAGLGDFPDRLRLRRSRPLTVADFPGCRDKASLAGTDLPSAHSQATGVDGRGRYVVIRAWVLWGRTARGGVAPIIPGGLVSTIIERPDTQK